MRQRPKSFVSVAGDENRIVSPIHKSCGLTACRPYQDQLEPNQARAAIANRDTAMPTFFLLDLGDFSGNGVASVGQISL
jgi:hypothetical protein